MPTRTKGVGSKWILARAELDGLVAALWDEGYEVLGPVVKGGAVVLGRVRASAELPVGLTDVQSPGSYRLKPRGDDAVFGFAVGPESYKSSFFPSEQPLVKLRRRADDIDVNAAG